MKTSDYIANTIDRLPRGHIFTYEDFTTNDLSAGAIVKALNRLVSSGKISKLTKGKFYKPEVSIFGELEPTKLEVVKDLLEEDGKTIGYLTGLGIYNELGLTTQISNVIQIGKRDWRPSFKRGRYKILIVKQKNVITKENIRLLQILDAINYINKIPDSTLNQSTLRIIELIKLFTDNEISTVQKLALNYPPSTRALLGAILEFIGIQDLTLLKNSLNPISTYRYDTVDSVLPTSKNWNIK